MQSNEGLSAGDYGEKLETIQSRFVAVIGLHSSGSSCLAGVLYHLNLHLGDRLGGYYGNSPETNNCGFEDQELADICEAAIPFPGTAPALDRREIQNRLRQRIYQLQNDAAVCGKIACGKYPLLCQLGPELIEICQDQLRVIVSDRRIESSIESLKRRAETIPAETIESHQRWLQTGKAWLLDQLHDSQKLIVLYDSLVADAEQQVQRIAEFLDLFPTNDQLNSVRNSIKR